MAQDTDVRALMLQVDAAVTLAERNLAKLSNTVERERGKMQSQLNALDKSFEKVGAGLGKAGSLIKSFGAGALTGLLGGGLVAASKTALEYAGSLGEVASQVGVTTRFLQEFRFAAAQSGLSTEEADGALTRLTRTLGEAQTGSEKAIKAFQSIGVSQKELATLTPEKAYARIADAIKSIPEPAKRAAVEVEFFSRAGQKLNPLLEQGADGFKDLADQAREFGVVLSDQQIQDADKTADKIAALQTALKVKIASVVADNADSIGKLANSLADLANEAGQISDTQWKYILAAAGVGFVGFGPIGAIAAGGVTAAAAIDMNQDARAVMPGQQVRGARYDPKTGKFTGMDSSSSPAPANVRIDSLNSGSGGRGKRAREFNPFFSTDVSGVSADLAREFQDRFKVDPYISALVEEANAGTKTLEERVEALGAAWDDEKAKGNAAAEERVRLLDEANARVERFANDLTDGLGQAIIYGQDLGTALVNSIKAAAAELIASGLLDLLLGKKDGTGGRTGGALASIGAAIFGGPRATGGPVDPSRFYMVGERGPEMFVPDVPGRIIPNNAMGGQQSVAVSVKVEPSPLFVATVAQTSQAAGARAAMGVVKASRNSGIPRV